MAHTITTSGSSLIYNFDLPMTEMVGFKKFVARIKPNIPALRVSFGEPFEKAYTHVIKTEDEAYTKVYMHKVSAVEVVLPAVNDWELVASFKDGLTYLTDYTHEVQFQNPAHGLTYPKCDLCGHPFKNSFVVRNVQSGEELQVGGSCVKKFGLSFLHDISLFTAELYRIYKLYGYDGDDLPIWSGVHDPSAFSAVETTRLLMAARIYYGEHPTWIKGYYEGEHYIQSESNRAIQSLVLSGDFEVDEDYVAAVRAFTMDRLPDSLLSEFMETQKILCSAYYAQPANAPHAYFMVKAYEDHLAQAALPAAPVSVGDQVHITGVVIERSSRQGLYEETPVYRIRTEKGYLFERNGKIPMEGDSTSFYAFVRHIGRRYIYLDRALKHPKKDHPVIEL